MTLNIKELQQAQAEYDAIYWNDIKGVEDVRHVVLHLQKLLGKMAEVCEKYEHDGLSFFSFDLARQIPADLLIYALHLSNRFGYDLQNLYDVRIRENKAKHDRK